MQIDIIGAGIGGLTLAIALEQMGIKTCVYEQAESIKPIGAGIILANNAMQVFEKLGLREAIEAKGNPISSMNITKANLKPISKGDLTYFEAKYKVKNIAIHRGVLQQILIDKLPDSTLKLNHKLNQIQKTASGYSLLFENNEKIAATSIIAADGIHSLIRKYLFPNSTIRKANQICWRGITNFNLPEKYRHELNEAWGKTGRFGFVQITQNKVYWYALKALKKDDSTVHLSDIAAHYKTYNPLVKSLISSTNKAEIHSAEIADLKPMKNWSFENICLMGDAAHAMTPNLGQGACQAIEDAFILAKCINKYEVSVAFDKFQHLRLTKANKVVKTSWMVGKIAHLSNPISMGIRDSLMQIMPASINQKQLEQIFKIPVLKLAEQD
ncbi:monooxygenase [Putridiphycobacter roseus]|uniref:Monooxygenase n=1 Tax=Putridiphycobacter roseus TaxID=2219161 RepID=A0A2W1NGV3_9FLAO|nr:FAD-dependent monooxygenase [Putridiphycobacter roseus]PZE17216.1 monooxygenase [Putridiphycobacter roseus]